MHPNIHRPFRDALGRIAHVVHDSPQRGNEGAHADRRHHAWERGQVELDVPPRVCDTRGWKRDVMTARDGEGVEGFDEEVCNCDAEIGSVLWERWWGSVSQG